MECYNLNYSCPFNCILECDLEGRICTTLFGNSPCSFYPQNAVRLLSESSFLEAQGLLALSVKLKDFRLYMLKHFLWGWQLVSCSVALRFFKFKWASLVSHIILLIWSSSARIFFLWSWSKQVVMTEHFSVTKSLLYANPQAPQTRKVCSMPFLCSYSTEELCHLLIVYTYCVYWD